MNRKSLASSIIAGLSALSFAASAAGPQAAPVANPVAKAYAIADAYWGGSYCGGHYPLAYSANPPGNVNVGPPEKHPTGEGIIQAWATPGDPTCTINLNTAIWSPRFEARHFQYFCDVITHEIGHFFGHLDEGQTDEASIQYSTIKEGSPNYNSVPGCILPKPHHKASKKH